MPWFGKSLDTRQTADSGKSESHGKVDDADEAFAKELQRMFDQEVSHQMAQSEVDDSDSCSHPAIASPSSDCVPSHSDPFDFPFPSQSKSGPIKALGRNTARLADMSPIDASQSSRSEVPLPFFDKVETQSSSSSSCQSRHIAACGSECVSACGSKCVSARGSDHASPRDHVSACASRHASPRTNSMPVRLSHINLVSEHDVAPDNHVVSPSSQQSGLGLAAKESRVPGLVRLFEEKAWPKNMDAEKEFLSAQSDSSSRGTMPRTIVSGPGHTPPSDTVRTFSLFKRAHACDDFTSPSVVKLPPSSLPQISPSLRSDWENVPCTENPGSHLDVRGTLVMGTQDQVCDDARDWNRSESDALDWPPEIVEENSVDTISFVCEPSEKEILDEDVSFTWVVPEQGLSPPDAKASMSFAAHQPHTKIRSRTLVLENKPLPTMRTLEETVRSRATSCSVDLLDEVVCEMEQACEVLTHQHATIETEHDALMQEVYGVLHAPSRPKVSRPSVELLELERYVNALVENHDGVERVSDISRDCVVATPRPLQVSLNGKPPIPPRVTRGNSFSARSQSGAFPLWTPAVLGSSLRSDPPTPQGSVSSVTSLRLAQVASAPKLSFHPSVSPIQHSANPSAMSPLNRHTILFTPHMDTDRISVSAESHRTIESDQRASESFRVFQKNAFRPYDK